MPNLPANSHASPLDAMRRLRVIVADIAAGRPLADADRAWFLACFDHYEAEAPISGISLEKAFGLRPPIGRSTWWSQEQLALRDETIRAIADHYFGTLGIADQARQIERAARLVARGRQPELPPEARALIQRALTGQRVFPAKDQVENILRN
jgi:hypothetical protein